MSHAVLLLLPFLAQPAQAGAPSDDRAKAFPVLEGDLESPAPAAPYGAAFAVAAGSAVATTLGQPHRHGRPRPIPGHDHRLDDALPGLPASMEDRAFDRRAFATGAVRAAIWATGKPPGLYSMMDVLGMR